MNPLLAEQMRNVTAHHASTLRMVRTDIKADRIDDIVFGRLDEAIKALDLMNSFFHAKAKPASDWICDEGGLHTTGSPCDCEPEEDDQ